MKKAILIPLIVMIGGFLLVGLWDRYPIISDSANFVLNPTAGRILEMNPTGGLIVITGIVILILTLVQKYTTDQEELKRLKKEQKILQEEIKKYKDNPEKVMELNKKQFEFIPKTLELTMSSLLYTFVPIILFFRWFSDYFAANPVKIFGFMSWFWAYLIFAIVFSTIYRKLLKMP